VSLEPGDCVAALVRSPFLKRVSKVIARNNFDVGHGFKHSQSQHILHAGGDSHVASMRHGCARPVFVAELRSVAGQGRREIAESYGWGVGASALRWEDEHVIASRASL
jgi:hypothetical protein